MSVETELLAELLLGMNRQTAREAVEAAMERRRAALDQNDDLSPTQRHYLKLVKPKRVNQSVSDLAVLSDAVKDVLQIRLTTRMIFALGVIFLTESLGSRRLSSVLANIIDIGIAFDQAIAFGGDTFSVMAAAGDISSKK